MEELKPFYYDKFKCIGNKCKDTCCAGWKVTIDKKSYLKYKNVRGEFSSRIKSSITRIRKNNNDLCYAEMKLVDGRCQFLNENSLCDIYINLGESYLCNTCKQYPRIIHKYNDLYEKNLNLSCPEVARILVTSNEVFSFNIDNSNLNDIEKQLTLKCDIHKNIYKVLWEGRSLSIDLAQFKEIEIWKRIMLISIASEEFQKIIDEGRYGELNKTIDDLKKQFTSESYINYLDSFSKNVQIKIGYIKLLLQRKANSGVGNDIFIKFLDDFNYLLESYNSPELYKKFESDEEKFYSYMKKFDGSMENYIVYLLYNNYFKITNAKVMKKAVLMIALNYSTIKMLLFGRWKRNNEEIKEEDVVDVLYSYSRVMEHNDSFINELYKDINQEGYNSLGYLYLLVR